MPTPLIYPIGTTDAIHHAAAVLAKSGIALIHHPSPEVTHLLLDIRPGCDPGETLRMLPPDTTVIGGNLNLHEHQVWDLLQDAEYLAQNAAITAHCAIKAALPYLNTILPDTPTLILGWGRIGKCLASLLKGMHCPVTVAARKASDRAMLRAMGYCAQDTARLDLKDIQLVFNTVPELLLSQSQLAPYPGIVKIELASSPGMAGPDIVNARGLPGILAPVSSGNLIARTILRRLKEERS